MRHSHGLVSGWQKYKDKLGGGEARSNADMEVCLRACVLIGSEG